MIRSMTGFGYAEKICDGWFLRVETRTVNHRELQVTFRMPEPFRLKEVALQKVLQQELHRGHVYFSLVCERQEAEGRVHIDEETVSHYLRSLKALSAEQGVPLQVDLASILRLPGTLQEAAVDEELRETLWDEVVEVTRDALDALVEMRRNEGENLQVQLRQLCDEMSELIDDIEKEQEGFVPAYRDRLRERLNRLLEGTDVELNAEVVGREAAVYADRCDVSEEIARLRSHIDQFHETLGGSEEPAGRRMEFIGQEMLREAGTIASKVPAGRQVVQVLDLKTAVERLREQVRNVE